MANENVTAAPSPPGEQSGLIGRMRRHPAWQALKVRDFSLLWIGETVSVVGDQFYFIALPWLTLQLTGSGLALGTVLVTAAIPRGALVLLGGAIADRVSPRLLMLGSNLVRMVLAGLLAALVLLGVAKLFELYIIAFLFGVSDAAFYPAYDSMAPLLLDESNLQAGNSLLQGSTMLSQMIGPGLAGVVIASLGSLRGSGVALALDAVSFALSAITLFLIRRGARAVAVPERGAENGRLGLLGDIQAGIVYAWRDPILRAILAIMIAGSVAVNAPAEIGLPWLAHSRFPQGATAFGIMFTVFGLGSLIGTVIAGVISEPRRRGLMIAGCAFSFSVGLALLGIAPNVVVASAILALVGSGNGFLGVVVITWLQTRTDPAMMGRVMSLLLLANVGLSPLALAPAGALAQYNVTLLFAVGGVLMAIVALSTLLSRAVRTFD